MMDGYISNKILESLVVQLWQDAIRGSSDPVYADDFWSRAFYQLLALRSLISRTNGMNSDKYKMLDFLVDMSIKMPGVCL